MRFMIYSSRLDYELNRISFSIYSSTLLYFLFQIIPAIDLKVDWTLQLVKMISLCLLIKVGMTIAIAVLASLIRKYTDRQAQNLKGWILRMVVGMSENFDFIAGINGGIPLVFIGVSYLTQNPLILLPALIVILYAFALVDKYRIIKLCKPLAVKSPKYMLSSFKAFQCTLIFSLMGGSFVWLR